MKKLVIISSVVLSIIFFAYWSAVTENANGDDIDYDLVSPAEKHQILADAKAGRLEIARKFADEAAKTTSLYDQTDYDVGFYDIDLNVDILGETISGVVEMSAVALVNSLDTIEVDLYDILNIDSIYYSGGLLNYYHGGNKIFVELDHSHSIGEEFSFAIVYNGAPSSTGFLGFTFDINGYGDRVVSTLSEPYAARTWWPCKDRPDDKADSLDITVTCDEPFFCASNGNLIDTVHNGDGTWTFEYEVRYPIVTYLFSLAISDYSIWEDYYYYDSDSMVIRHHVYPARYAYSLTKYDITPNAIQVFSDLFGQYPFLDEKYGHANFEWSGGMEHQTITSMTGGSFGFSQDVVVHELAHQWWGDMITCENFHHIWLNEGFASYCEALYREVVNGTEDYHDYMNGMFYSYGGTIYAVDTTSVGGIFTSRVYDKGAWFLHMLRHIVGDTTFFDILQAYYNSAHQHSHANTEDFQAICESVSGMDLNYFFEDWIYGEYFPNYNWSHYTEEDPSDGRYFTYLYIWQTQVNDPDVFRMPIDFVFTSAGGVDTIVQFNDAKDTVYIFKTDNEPTQITLDPNDWILKLDSPSGWLLQLIPFGLHTGEQYLTYTDSVVAKGGTGDIRYTINSGALPSGLTLDSLSGEISGVPTEFGDFAFEIKARDASGSWSDFMDYSMSIIEGFGMPGDANNDTVVNLLDITYIINYLYAGGAAPVLLNNADPNQDCSINILDITYLIAFLYQGGPAPLIGCVE